MPVDALNRTIDLPAPPRRIVSLVPSLTEYLFAIGLGPYVVGVTDYCIAPAAQVASLPKVRGTKNPNRELIRALQPDLVLASKEENRERDVVALTAMGIPVYVTDIQSVADALAQLTALAQLLAAEHAAAPLLHALETALAQAQQALLGRCLQRTLVFIWRDPWMAAGATTYIDDVLRLCGAENLARQMPGRYPRADLADFMRLNPEVILLPDEPYHFTEADRDAFVPFAVGTQQLYCCAPTPRIHLCDGMLLTWPGPRTITALHTLPSLLEGSVV